MSSNSTTKPIRIAHFLGTMRPGHDGVTRVMYRMREMFDPSVATHRFISPILPDPVPEDMRTVRSVPMMVSTDYRLSMASPDALRELLEDSPPDLVHIHSPCTLGRAAVRYAAMMGIPSVATYHTHFPTYLSYYKVEFMRNWAWNYMRKLYGHCSAIIVPSRATLTDLAANGLHHLVHVPHGVETAKFSPDKRSTEWRRSVGGDDKVIVSFVGRLVWEKNLALLADAYKLMKNRDLIRMVVVGDGPARAKLEPMIPGAHFTGNLDEKTLPPAYASSDLFVFPSITETFGNVTVEAMASGLPAICASQGGACDIVRPGENGLLVSGQDAQELADAMDRLVISREEREKMSKAALAASARYRWDITVRRYESLYRDVLTQYQERQAFEAFVAEEAVLLTS